MLEKLDDVLGSPDALARKLQPHLERAILDLVVEGFERWAASGFPRHGDGENEFTAVLIGQMREVRRERNLPFVPEPEHVEYSSEVLAGRAPPNRAPRIDISIAWDMLAENGRFTIECKRLALGRLVREYVDEGLLRFVSGRYASTTPAAGMVGYVIQDDPTTIWSLVNQRVTQRTELLESDRLTTAEPIRSCQTVYVSRHQRSESAGEVRLIHIFFDVRHRMPI